MPPFGTGSTSTGEGTTGKVSLERLTRRVPGTLVGLLGIEVTETGRGAAHGQLEVRPELLAPNGYLHAGSVVSFADTIAGFGCWANLPDDAMGFTTAELKTNLLGTARSGMLTCTATLRHGGRSTQVWDAEVANEDGKVIALFRCTQMILYPRS